MTPIQLEEMARRRYNAVNDSFFSQDEIFDYIWHAQMQLAKEARVIEKTYTTDTVVSQQGYAFPTNALDIKRITYEGQKLDPICQREDDVLTLLNQQTTSTGTPSSYFIWENTIFLRDIPGAVGELKIFSYDMPQQVTSTSVIDVPTEHHFDLLYFVLAEMALKDKNQPDESGYRTMWEMEKRRALARRRARLRGDSPAHVKDIDSIVGGVLGNV